MLVTVVTVTYNAEELLEATVNSVINQTYKNIEYIIIDGASTDGTVNIIRKYEAKIDYWISEPDEGIYYAMNKAIEKASGEFINFMNAGDTFADNDTVRYVMENKTQDAELIYGDYIRLNPDRICKAQVKSMWYSTMPFCHQTLFTRTNIAKNVMFDTRYKIAADHDFVIKMYEENRVFQYMGHNLARYAGGGYSKKELLTSCVESLYILLHSKASEDEIKASLWYKALKRDFSEEYIAKIEKYIATIKKYREAFKILASIKFLYHPIKKIKSYKKLMKTYHALK
jgi:glycosyltransferase involved in cell wall biosynthesis